MLDSGDVTLALEDEHKKSTQSSTCLNQTWKITGNIFETGAKGKKVEKQNKLKNWRKKKKEKKSAYVWQQKTFASVWQ